jgi:predicted unusual protein kinase regulating ubiquinone biosynthesis (AarF/ABC1/UbiB family)
MYRSRYRRILRFFRRLLLGVLWWDILLPKVGLGGLARRTRPARLRRGAAAFRSLAVRMGGVLIKVGQFLSARLDVLPREITGELAGLQDEVGPERFEEIRGVIEAELGPPPEQAFVELDPVPLASASIGQVHRARLCHASPEGGPCPPVVVKVQRPRIQEIVEADLAAIRMVGRRLARFRYFRRHADIPALIEEFSRSLHEEIDYLQEGRNAERFAANFHNHPRVRVPQVVWSHTTRRVLTLQDVTAIKITDYPAIEAAGIDRGEVAGRLADTYLKQIFEDGFFHADPHPGNLFVRPAPTAADPGAWELVFIDFGMTGTLAPPAFAGLREALVAVGTRDAARLVGAYRRLGLLLPGADLDMLERANRRVFETVWGKSTRELMELGREDARRFVEEFGELLYQMPFQAPENLILLGRCLGILSGMAFGLDPDFNLWQVVAPYALKLMEEGGESGARLVLREITEALRLLAALPKRTDALLARAEQGRLEVRVPELKQQVTRLERSARKLGGAIVFAAGLVAATQLYLGGHPGPALVVGLLEGGLLGWLVFAR